MQRINIVGTSGSGKSLLAEKLAKTLGYPLIEIDALHWGPNWTSAAPEVLQEKLRSILLADAWVLDGNYGSHTDVKWERATHVIWLDYPFPLVLWQVTKRSLHRSLFKTDLWGTGNRETLKQTFLSKESIILWVLQTHFGNRRKYLERMQAKEYSHINFVRLRSRQETEAYLRTLSLWP